MEEVLLLSTIYLRIFVSPNANISNERIVWDIYLARKILAPIQIVRFPNPMNGLGYYELPQNYNYSSIICSLSGDTEIELANFDPGDGFRGDGRLINVYYLGGGADDGACDAVALSEKGNRGKFPILGSIYMSNFNDDFGKYLFTHELVHILFARFVNNNNGGNFIQTINMDDPTAPPGAEDQGHSTNEQNLMFPIVPDSSPFVQAYRQAIQQGTPVPQVPRTLLTSSQREKALNSQFVFK